MRNKKLRTFKWTLRWLRTYNLKLRVKYIGRNEGSGLFHFNSPLNDLAFVVFLGHAFHIQPKMSTQRVTTEEREYAASRFVRRFGG